MQAALLPDRGVVNVAGSDAAKFLNGLVTADIGKVTPGEACFAALLTPQGKIIVDFIVAAADVADGGGFFLDCPRALAATLVERLNFYKLRAKVTIEDFSESLGVMTTWPRGGVSDYALCYADPRLSELGARCILPRDLAGEAAADLDAELVEAEAYETYRIALGVPRRVDHLRRCLPHETDMDQPVASVPQGCFVGRRWCRASSRRRAVVNRLTARRRRRTTAGERNVGMMGRPPPAAGTALPRPR
jgi:folate-binding Fe-S cluster repair protein YgfZ